MSGPATMLLSVGSLCVLLVTGGLADSLEDALERGTVSLNEMFREVEMLMEDTQQILDEAVDQISAESAKSLHSLDFIPNYHNNNHTSDGDRNVRVLDRTDKQIDNKTGDIHLSHIHSEISGQWNSVDHNVVTFIEHAAGNKMPARQECMVDEDCGDMRYCLYEIENSKCLPCIPTDMPCTKDEECCAGDMCVWGQCSVNATRGTEGTICQFQSDCSAGLCCAFQRELLFPVCNPRPEQGESCVSHPNLLMDMLAWDQEGPRDHCPCAPGLQCKPHGRGSLCGK